MNVGICHNSDRKYCKWPFGPRIFRDEGDAPNEILRPSLHAPNGSQIINFACRYGFSHPEPARHFLQTPRAEAREKKTLSSTPLYCILPFSMPNPLCLSEIDHHRVRDTDPGEKHHNF
ncbi:hypothetical protein AVEN_258040-1 [Araneus ventricosus]|uniref:Uncharacterized protein n=1 Tax=Araneus ventricosus TaxID=182803 RepID=A0A4Y2AAB4_ARAVE|nr:hypothetical protein AVEN_258040-1 [Araneus ventricosus]